MIYTDKVTTNRIIQDLFDSGKFTTGQIDEIHKAGCKIFAVGYDIGRLENPAEKQVIQLDDYGKKVDEFNSITEAAKKTGVCRESIKRVVHGQRNRAGGYCWRFKHLEDYGII